MFTLLYIQIGTWSQINFQDANSPIMEELHHLHDYINLILIYIICFVATVIVIIVLAPFINTKLIQVQIVEWVWTLTPAIILLQIALPRLLLLYIIDEVGDSTFPIKAIGHQWYWSYEYEGILSDRRLPSLEFDSYIIPSNELEKDIIRLLEVDNRTILPIRTRIRVLITSADVLHSWTVPSLGVKADAVPGRLNHVKIISDRPGLYRGQCSEICGAGHRLIPIILELVDFSSFITWIFNIQE